MPGTIHSTGHTSTQAPSRIHRSKITYVMGQSLLSSLNENPSTQVLHQVSALQPCIEMVDDGLVYFCWHRTFPLRVSSRKQACGATFIVAPLSRAQMRYPGYGAQSRWA